jgi:hypothetical protein
MRPFIISGMIFRDRPLLLTLSAFVAGALLRELVMLLSVAAEVAAAMRWCPHSSTSRQPASGNFLQKGQQQQQTGGNSVKLIEWIGIEVIVVYL